MTKAVFIINTFIAILLLQSCSGNGFHLRKNVNLPAKYQSIQLENLPAENGFIDVFQEALEEAGGQISEHSSSKIIFSDFQQGRRVVAYTSDRKAREYLLFLKFDYALSNSSDSTENEKYSKRRINIDRSYLYDPDFALGKAEEEKQVQKNLYQEAARLILLRLQYSQ